MQNKRVVSLLIIRAEEKRAEMGHNLVSLMSQHNESDVQ